MRLLEALRRKNEALTRISVWLAVTSGCFENYSAKNDTRVLACLIQFLFSPYETLSGVI